MAYELRWEIEKRVMYLKYYGVVEIKDIVDANEKIYDEFEKADQPLHFLVDGSETTFVNLRLYDLLSLDILKKNNEHPMQGMIVAFDQENALVVFMGKSVVSTFDNDGRFFDTKEEAIASLISRDPELSDLFD